MCRLIRDHLILLTVLQSIKTNCSDLCCHHHHGWYPWCYNQHHPRSLPSKLEFLQAYLIIDCQELHHKKDPYIISFNYLSITNQQHLSIKAACSVANHLSFDLHDNWQPVCFLHWWLLPPLICSLECQIKEDTKWKAIQH